MTDAQLETRVRSALARKAEQIEPADRAFTPEPAPLAELTVPRRAPRRVALVASVLALVLVSAGGAAVVLNRSESTSPRADRVAARSDEPAASPAPVPALAPSFVPPGLELSGMSTRLQNVAPIFTTQLFGTVDASGAPSPGILLRIQPGTGGTAPGDVLQVRGVTGSSAAPKEAVGTSETITWSEGGASVSATVRGMTRADAVAALNDMQARSTDARDGFDPGSLPLLGEALAKTADPKQVAGTFLYAPADRVADAPATLRVETSTHADYPGYLGLWSEGHRNADGSVLVQDPGWGLNLAWPDGRQVLVYSTSNDWPTLERVARAVRPESAAQLAETETALNRRLAALPLIVRAEAGSVRAELRGTGTPTTLCMEIGASTRCSSPFGSGGEAVTTFKTSAIIDGTWQVVVAAQVPVQLRASLVKPGPDIARHVTADGWDFAFADVAADLQQVTLLQGPDYLQGEGLDRPDR